MDRQKLERLLESVRAGDRSVPEALQDLRDMPFRDLGYARVDHHRPLRNGVAEVIFGETKEASQIVEIAAAIASGGSNVLVTRLDPEKAARVRDGLPALRFDPVSRTGILEVDPGPKKGRGTIAVVTAGTSDIPVAEEAAVTAEFLGHVVERVHDVGVAGIHRLFERKAQLEGANVLVVVAGMEGALPSVVGGLVSRPVVAVPTSVGYGASYGGLAALLAMLNSCAAGITVVNVDNGFGAGVAAARINE
ncbi:MAG: nickel pincer cofactor biosynthesis protein LarB [Actinobacteria bacterium]|nr:nickel pincer cofactor biosynthesis protein LarB [Actinomycetota bacterium]